MVMFGNDRRTLISLLSEKPKVSTLIRHTTQLPATVVAPAAARVALNEAFDPPIPEGVLETARLLITELVTNSIRHTAMPPGSTIRLEIGADDGRLLVEVHDAGREITDLRPAERPIGGYGLRLVDQLADRWGSDRSERGTCVWFELSLSTPRHEHPSLTGLVDLG